VPARFARLQGDDPARLPREKKPMATYSFADCLENAYKVNWKIADVLDGRDFDLRKNWLPDRLSGAGQAGFLDAAEKRKLTHVEMAAYAHLFGYVEEFIAPTVLDLAQGYQIDDRTAFDALTNFAAEEVKHMNLFRLTRDKVSGTLGFPMDLLGGREETARFVTSKNRGAVLLLTACIEWFTQLHYRECFEDNTALDPLTKHIFKCHWLEESQHAKMDHLETIRHFEGASDAERDQAIDDLIELVAAVDGLLQTQTGHDIDNLSRYLGRTFSIGERQELFIAILKAKRYTFLESGVTHPRFVELFQAVATPEQQQRVGTALAGLFAAKVAAA
jgi:P-aminobenzoate N-oxygenase AurF